MELVGLSGRRIWGDTRRVIVVLAAIILVVGLTDLGDRLSSEIRARLRSRAAKRMMARTLKAFVRRANAQQAVAALRLSRKDDIEPLEKEAARTELLQKIEILRLRTAGLSNNRQGVEEHEGRKRRPQGRAAESCPSGAGAVTMPERHLPAESAIPEMVFPQSRLLERAAGM